MNKYKIGQKVFRMEENKAQCEAVTSISKRNDERGTIFYGFRNENPNASSVVNNWEEEKLFPTKEALLKSL